ncbi:MAG: DUF4433 domain-containing protein [Clostridium sp.]|nr:DUF4433 domain-containing protein [Clostridium sp.]
MYKEKEFVYLCMYRNKARDMRFEIIPRHPLNMNPFKMYNYEEGMEIIDWDTMDLREYSNYECKEICMAECVHKGDLGIDNFSGIYVRTNEAKCYVEDILYEYGVTSVSVFLSPNYFVNH